MQGTELTTQGKQMLTAIDIRKQVNLIQEVMKEVMQNDTHYGLVPGCGNKPTLLKPGAEKLAMTFRLSPDYEELPGSSESDSFICYKINCKLTHIPTGLVVGNGRGMCNSKEKKYRTRSVYANKATDEEKKIGKEETRNNYKVYVVPQDPWDVQNTIYKMACKRALIAAVLNATAASDIFTQDIEDLPEGTIVDDERVVNAKPEVDMPKSKAETAQQKPPAPKQEVDDSFDELAEKLSADQPEVKVVDVGTLVVTKIGAVVPAVEGILSDYKVRKVTMKKDNSQKDITDYTISDENNNEWAKISKWGGLSEGIEIGATVRFSNVQVGTFRNERAYLADGIALAKKATNE